MLFIDLMDIIGTAAFAVSGVLVGIRNKLDLFGILVLSIFTAAGGGLIRDVIIGNGLPVFFTQPRYFIIIVLSMIVTIAAYRFIDRIHFLIQVFDAVGLGVFTILAAYKSILLGVPPLGVVFLAALTGIGGGILRDILVNDIPLVFRSEIYAFASIIGAICFYFLYKYNVLGTNTIIYLCIFIIFAIRMASIYFKLNLPPIKVKDE